MKKIWQQEIKLPLFVTILSVLNVLLYNIPFLQFIVNHAEMEGITRIILIISFIALLFTINFLAFYLILFLLRPIGKALIAVFSILSAICVYFIITYHTMMDESMLGNVFNTRYSEASNFFTWGLVLWVIFLGIIPAVWICRQKIAYGNWKTLGGVCGGSIVATAILILININQVLWIGKYDTELGGLVMPWSYTVNTCRIWSHHLDKQQKEIILDDAQMVNHDRSVMVLVIGESARKANFSLYGYPRNTNPLLSEVDNLHVLEATSCATYTTAGVKSILEYKPTKKLYEILPNYLYRAGVDVVWRTSNWGEPPVHIEDYINRKNLAKQLNIKDKIYDEILFHGIKERIEQSDKEKVLIILHTSTSHGPDYQSQYPPSFEKFTPVCNNVEEAQKNRDMLINAYDNSILYTDWMLRGLIDTLQTIRDRHCAMIYVSDHGESLGENELYMHGVPMKMAPREQYEIPFIVWTDNSYLTFRQPENSIDQHYVFHSILRWLGFDSPIYNEETSLF